MKFLLTTLLLAGTIAGAHATEPAKQPNPFSIDNLLHANAEANAKAVAEAEIQARAHAEAKAKARAQIIYDCQVLSSATSTTPDYAKEADCLEQQFAGYDRVQVLLAKEQH